MARGVLRTAGRRLCHVLAASLLAGFWFVSVSKATCLIVSESSGTGPHQRMGETSHDFPSNSIIDWRPSARDGLADWWGVTCRLAVSAPWHIPGMDTRRAGMQAAPRWAVRAVGVRPLVVVWLGWARGGILASTHTLRVAYGI